MVDVQTIGVLVTAASVSIAAIYYMLTLRNTIDNRKAQLLIECNRIMNSKEFVLDLHETLNYEWKDFDDFWQKYGHPSPAAHTKWIYIANLMGSTLDLVDSKLISEDMARKYLGYVNMGSFWEKFGPMIREMRVRMNLPNMFEKMEFYYDRWQRTGSKGREPVYTSNARAHNP
jgi:hypothetical protein